MLRFLPLLIKHRRLLMYFAPLVLDLLKSNKSELDKLVSRPDTSPRDDMKDALKRTEDDPFGYHKFE